MPDKYLSDTGSDGGSGNSLGNAYATLDYALGAMAQNDRLLVKGTHTTSNSSFANLKNGSGSGTYTQIEAIDFGVTKFLCGTSAHRVVVYPDQTAWVSMKGFVIDGNSRLGSYGIRGSLTAIDDTLHSTNLLYEDIEILQCNDSGVKLHAANCILRRMNIHHCGKLAFKNGHGMYIGADDRDNLFEDIELSFNSNLGMQNYSTLSSGQTGPIDNIYRNINAHHNGAQGIWLDFDCRGENLVCWKNGSAGLILSARSGFTASAFFVTCYGNATDGSAAGIITQGAGNTVLRNYLSLGNLSGNFSNSAGGSRTTSNGIITGTASNYFRDAENGDFHLNDGEPTTSDIVGQGVAVSGITTDFDGATRTTPPDIGPFQRDGVSGDTPPVNVIPVTRVTQINVDFSFEDFDVSHGGDLSRIIVYPQSGSLA